ncbi:hypothetical protein, partial [Haloferula sp. A504]|uniref:hypothetical protein n=1 Tax=Haloferula sp. A504 TaxID=3373601 RepID=UPI0031C83FE3|nr:hypothetical protein [Verrucomicrobiaceae bacterium E54]
DTIGRLETVTLTREGGGFTPHVVQLHYNGASDEISGVSADGFSASYGRHAGNRSITGITRGPVIQTWGRGPTGRITSANSNVTGTPDFGYASFDTKGRRKTVVTNRGTWTYSYRGGDG